MDKELQKEYEDFFDRLKKENPAEYKRLMDLRNMHITMNFKELPLENNQLDWFSNKGNASGGEYFEFKQSVLKKGKNLTNRQLQLHDLYYGKKKNKQQVCKIMSIKICALNRQLHRLQKKLT